MGSTIRSVSQNQIKNSDRAPYKFLFNVSEFIRAVLIKNFSNSVKKRLPVLKIFLLILFAKKMNEDYTFPPSQSAQKPRKSTLEECEFSSYLARYRPVTTPQLNNFVPPKTTDCNFLLGDDAYQNFEDTNYEKLCRDVFLKYRSAKTDKYIPRAQFLQKFEFEGSNGKILESNLPEPTNGNWTKGKSSRLVPLLMPCLEIDEQVCDDLGNRWLDGFRSMHSNHSDGAFDMTPLNLGGGSRGDYNSANKNCEKIRLKYLAGSQAERDIVSSVFFFFVLTKKRNFSKPIRGSFHAARFS
jgi:hypothetical protein